MKFNMMLSAAALTAMCAAGCASTEIYDDPENQRDDVRSELSYTSAELRKAADKVLDKMLEDPDLDEYVAEYKKANGGKRPLMKLAPVKNETDDPDLTTSELDSFIENRLRLSRKVRITRAEGTEKINAVSASRDLEDDENFRQDTVAKRGTLEAAKLLMRPHLVSNNVSDGRKRRITRTFTVDVVRIDTGEVLFTCTEQLGFSKTRGAAGW